MENSGFPAGDHNQQYNPDSKDDESSEAESDYELKPAIANRFDLLVGSDDEVEEDLLDENAEEEKVQTPVENVEADVKETRPQKKKKRKKRKNASKTNGISKEIDADWDALVGDSTTGEQTYNDDEFLSIPDEYFRKTDDEKFRSEANEVFKEIREIAVERRAEEAKSNAASNSALITSLSAMSVEPRLLSADSELKKLFGFKVVEAERRNEEQEMANRAQRRGRGQRRVPPRSHIRRKLSLVNPREGWFSQAPGLSMVVDKDAPTCENGIRYFRYQHEGDYEKIQRHYKSIVATHDVNNLATLAARCPFHVDSLIQLAEVHRQMGELDRAAEQIERALHVLESAWNMAFKPFQGDCRLRFEVPENKAIYIALFRYAQLLTRRGLHRTALEISKLVLNFDPENDPMGILMTIDSLALLSEEYEWICTMQRDFKLIPLEYFPNFAFSGALAVFSLQNGAQNTGHRSSAVRKKKKKGKANGKDESEKVSEFANSSISPLEVLTNSLLAFPMALRPLLAASKDSGGSWSSHQLFSRAQGDGFDGVLYRMCRVYAERSNLLWKAGESKAVLHKAAIAATEIFDAGDKDERNAKATQLRVDAGQWLGIKGLYRAVQVADFADGNVNLPADLLADNGPVGERPTRPITTTEAVREFMQSFLPWRNVGDAANDAAAAPSGGQTLDAMWEMLENLNILPDRGGARERNGNGDPDPPNDR